MDDEALIFGNQGALFMQAMTWFDHGTESVWSQVWGQAIAGPLTGATLDLITASIVPWSTWRESHPETLALVTDSSRGFNARERPTDKFVIGISLGEHSKAYDYRALVREELLNDFVGPYPVVLIADGESRSILAYLRHAGDRLLTLDLVDGHLVDRETHSTWSPAQGIAVSGPLEGHALRPVPYLSSFDWAWLDFHPESEIYR